MKQEQLNGCCSRVPANRRDGARNDTGDSNMGRSWCNESRHLPGLSFSYECGDVDIAHWVDTEQAMDACHWTDSGTVWTVPLMLSHLCVAHDTSRTQERVHVPVTSSSAPVVATCLARASFVSCMPFRFAKICTELSQVALLFVGKCLTLSASSNCLQALCRRPTNLAAFLSFFIFPLSFVLCPLSFVLWSLVLRPFPLPSSSSSQIMSTQGGESVQRSTLSSV